MKFKEWFLVEMLGDSDYKLPKDKEQQLYDFYMLSLIKDDSGKPAIGEFDNEDKIKHRIHEINSVLLPELKKNLLDAVFYSICSEARHIFDQNSTKDLLKIAKESGQEKIFRNYVNGMVLNTNTYSKHLVRKPDDKNRDLYDNATEDRKASYFAALKSGSKPEFIKLLMTFFNEASWSESYGGVAWAKICEAWINLHEARSDNHMTVWIDHIYDIQHNTDTVFNKIKSYMKGGTYDWLKKALDHKARIKDPHEIIDKVSYPMRKIALRAIKSKTGKTYEDFLKKQPGGNLEKDEDPNSWTSIIQGAAKNLDINDDTNLDVEKIQNHFAKSPSSQYSSEWYQGREFKRIVKYALNKKFGAKFDKAKNNAWDTDILNAINDLGIKDASHDSVNYIYDAFTESGIWPNHQDKESIDYWKNIIRDVLIKKFLFQQPVEKKHGDYYDLIKDIIDKMNDQEKFDVQYKVGVSSAAVKNIQDKMKILGYSKITKDQIVDITNQIIDKNQNVGKIKDIVLRIAKKLGININTHINVKNIIHNFSEEDLPKDPKVLKDLYYIVADILATKFKEKENDELLNLKNAVLKITKKMGLTADSEIGPHSDNVNDIIINLKAADLPKNPQVIKDLKHIIADILDKEKKLHQANERPEFVIDNFDPIVKAIKFFVTKNDIHDHISLNSDIIPKIKEEVAKFGIKLTWTKPHIVKVFNKLVDLWNKKTPLSSPSSLIYMDPGTPGFTASIQKVINKLKITKPLTNSFQDTEMISNIVSQLMLAGIDGKKYSYETIMKTVNKILKGPMY